MNELKTIRSASIVDARTETENATYSVRYQYDEYDGKKSLQAIHVEISERQEGNLVNVGSMDYNSDQISMSGFPYSDKTSTYIDEFTAIVEEIKKLMI
ncbi:hypothetical protein [Bacteroides sp. OF04-15BH]|uniref:hypothetical protein n=1 Tax=Bacteroides sp. OF04-15BH TaxID=2292281 RepID=UPI000E4D1B41|nr:hypothetical protein [Bacteroides sp. OF04-15BH]RHP66712.1 hypothetical protein DXA74_02475 [Bacteroides sp. OF04-15BH]